MDKKITWTTIKVPTEIRDTVKNLAKKEGKAYWKVLIDALSFYEQRSRNPRRAPTPPLLDRISWYIAKVSMSVGAFKENPSDENFDRLMLTLDQIEERIGINVNILRRVVMVYKKKPSKDARVELNMALKMLIFDIIWTKIVGEEKTVYNPVYNPQK